MKAANYDQINTISADYGIGRCKKITFLTGPNVKYHLAGSTLHIPSPRRRLRGAAIAFGVAACPNTRLRLLRRLPSGFGEGGVGTARGEQREASLSCSLGRN